MPVGRRADRSRLTRYVTYADVDEDVRRPGLVLMQGWLAAADGNLPRALEILRPPLFSALESRTYWPWWPGWMPVFARVGLAASDARFAAEALKIAEEGAVRNPGVASFEGIALHVRRRDGCALGARRRVCNWPTRSMSMRQRCDPPGLGLGAWGSGTGTTWTVIGGPADPNLAAGD